MYRQVDVSIQEHCWSGSVLTNDELLSAADTNAILDRSACIDELVTRGIHPGKLELYKSLDHHQDGSRMVFYKYAQLPGYFKSRNLNAASCPDIMATIVLHAYVLEPDARAKTIQYDLYIQTHASGEFLVS